MQDSEAPPTEPTHHRTKAIKPIGAVGPVLTGQVRPEDTDTLPMAEEPVKFPWEDPLPGGQQGGQA